MASLAVLSLHCALWSIITSSQSLTQKDMKGDIEGKPTYSCLCKASWDLLKQLSSFGGKDCLYDEEDGVGVIIYYYFQGKNKYWTQTRNHLRAWNKSTKNAESCEYHFVPGHQSWLFFNMAHRQYGRC